MSNLWEFLWEGLPPGFRFHPTDEEFVNHYLKNYVLGIKDDPNIIPVVEDLFNRDPAELPHKFRESSIIRSKDPEWWFLSTLKCKSPNSNNFDRQASTGSWKSTGKPKEIRARGSDGSNKLIGQMRNLVFCNNLKNEKTNWVMHEYHLKDDDFGLCTRDQEKYVLCHLVNRQYDHTETSTNMEIDLHFDLDESQHSFSEEIVLAKIRSLLEGPSSPATDVSLGNPRSSTESTLMIREIGPLGDFDRTEYMMSTTSELDDIEDLLDNAIFYPGEESGHSNEFEVESVYEQLSAQKGARRAESEHTILKENQQARPLEILQGYVVIDETREFVEDNFQEQKDDPSSVTDSPTSPATKYPLADDVRSNPASFLHDDFVPQASSLRPESNDRRIGMLRPSFGGSNPQSAPVIKELQSTPCGRSDVKEGKGDTARATVRRGAVMGLHSTMPEINQKTRTGSLLSRVKESNEKDLVTFHEMNRDGDNPRPPSVYLVKLVTVIVIAVIILWLVGH